jgi:hypothetical protein
MGESVVRTSYNPKGIAGTFVKEDYSFQWGTSCLNIFEKAFGKDSPHYINFNNLFPKFLHLIYVSKALGVLRAAKDDYEQELLFDTRTLVEAEVFADFLQQAEHLLSSGYHQPAAIIAGCVLEDGLRKLCLRNRIPINDKIKLDTMNAELTKNGIYALLQQKQITVLADLRNKAAHGKWNEFDKQDVENMLKITQEFMAKYFS